VLAEGLSPLRNYADLNPYLISTYDSILRDPESAKNLAPQMVIRVGETPTSKVLRTWLSDTQPIQWLLEESDRNLDPLHLRTTHLRLSVEQLAMELPEKTTRLSPYLKQWCEAEWQVQKRRNQSMEAEESLIEGKVVWLMSCYLPPGTPLFIANSMPIRYMEWFWRPGNRRVQPFFNRGANGIDGTLSTALGMAHGNRPGVLLTGDLALLHDTNGFLVGDRLRGHLTIVVINNNGGGIFESLPIAQFDPPFEEFFATPQCVDLMKLCAAYAVEYEAVESWGHLQQRLETLPERGIRLLEVRCDRKANTRWLKKMLPLWGSGSL
jgi:2-succinyl-5-enolpyruvyl-6-hydroxy-3-cyclohexene-1-carboxylate synthase